MTMVSPCPVSRFPFGLTGVVTSARLSRLYNTISPPATIQISVSRIIKGNLHVLSLRFSRMLLQTQGSSTLRQHQRDDPISSNP